MESRVGIGYDAHRLEEGRRLVLGGVEIPHPKGLAGHSDADVLTHAVCDAVLGALALGDLGEHFPDTDPAWEGVGSLSLLERCCEMAAGLGWRVHNVDSSVAAQEPRLAPHREEMRSNLARGCGVGTDRVSVKATTTEGLGFAGRGEGMAAQAVVTLVRGD